MRQDIEELDLNMTELYKSLDRFPHLKKAVRHFEKTDGKSEHSGKLPNLIVWIRQVLPDEIDPAEFFDMDEETADDFYSWGSNSRWANTFRDYLNIRFEYCVACCIELAEDYGDYDIEKYMNRPTEA